MNATSVVQRDFNALVRKRLLVTRIDNPHSANGFGWSEVEYWSAERPVDGERGPGFSCDECVVGYDGRIGDYSRCVVPQIRWRRRNVLDLCRGGDLHKQKETKKRKCHLNRKVTCTIYESLSSRRDPSGTEKWIWKEGSIFSWSVLCLSKKDRNTRVTSPEALLSLEARRSLQWLCRVESTR